MKSFSNQKRRIGGFTLREVLAMLFVSVVLIWLARPNIYVGAIRSEASQMLNGGRQLYLAAFQLASDGLMNGDPRFGWPGDLALREGQGNVRTVEEYIDRLWDLDYLGRADVVKILQGPGIVPWDGKAGTFSGERNCTFKIYRVRETDDGSTIFTATRNFTVGQGVDRTSPLAKMNHGLVFVVVRKAGDGAGYKEGQARDWHALGHLPGHENPQPGDVETPADTLLQQ